MIYKLDENFNVIGKGTSLSPNAEKGEFILHGSVGKAALKEVADANGIEVGKKDSVDTLIKKIEANFETKDIPIMTDTKEKAKTELELKCEEIVKTGMEAGKDDDAIQVDLVGAGLKFKQAASTFKKLAELLGFRITSKARMDKIAAILEGYIPTTWDEVVEAAANLSKKVEDTTEQQAMACLRKIVKDAEKEFPKKPKGGDGKPRGFKTKAYAWMLENKNATKDELKAFLKENDKGDKKSLETNLLAVLEFARAYAS